MPVIRLVSMLSSISVRVGIRISVRILVRSSVRRGSSRAAVLSKALRQEESVEEAELVVRLDRCEAGSMASRALGNGRALLEERMDG